MNAQMAQELWLGPNQNMGSSFVDDAHRREVWFRFRDELMAQWGRHGRRPLAWWIYEKRWRYPGSEHERSLLYEADLLTHDLLTPEERLELEGFWRKEFDKTQVEGFTTYYEDKIVTGDEARQRHWIFIDLPPVLLDKFLAEREQVGALEEPVVA
jgi:hypothetical protein